MVHLSGFPRTVTFNTLLILLRQIAPKRDTEDLARAARGTEARIKE